MPKKKVVKMPVVEEVKAVEEVEEETKETKLITVYATDVYKKYGITDTQLGYVPEKGEKFEVTKERLEVLNENRWGEALVTTEKL